MNPALMITVITLQVLLGVQVQGDVLFRECLSNIDSNVDALKAQYEALDVTVSAACELIIAMDPHPETPEQCGKFLSELGEDEADRLLEYIKDAIFGEQKDNFCQQLQILHSLPSSSHH